MRKQNWTELRDMGAMSVDILVSKLNHLISDNIGPIETANL